MELLMKNMRRAHGENNREKCNADEMFHRYVTRPKCRTDKIPHGENFSKRCHPKMPQGRYVCLIDPVHCVL